MAVHLRSHMAPKPALLLLDKHSHRRSGGTSGGGTDKHSTLTSCVVSDSCKE